MQMFNLTWISRFDWPIYSNIYFFTVVAIDEFLVNPSFKKNLISRYISLRILYIYIYWEYEARIYWRLKNLASSRDSSLKDQPRVNPHLVLLPRRFLKVPRPCTRRLHNLLLWLLYCWRIPVFTRSTLWKINVRFAGVI